MGKLQGIVAREAGVAAELTELSAQELAPGDVTVAVSHSSLNYKDALAVTAAAPIVRSFPMVCGIDLAGTVTASDSPDWHPGDEVIATGWGLSESHPGGYTQLQRLDSQWLTAKPPAFTLAQCMAIGTAGLTAMLCVLALERAGVQPGEAPVLVTGAGGGVGQIAISLLAGLGFKVAASTGREHLHAHLQTLGAAEFVAREELSAPGRPLGSERWAGAIDSVGGQTLANVLAQTRYRGAVAACGLAGGADLPSSVLPFILRAVSLLGIDSVMCPAAEREAAWSRLERDLPASRLDQIATHEPLARVPELAAQMLEGRIAGRVVIDTGG